MNERDVLHVQGGTACSFTSTTPVATPEGEKAIGDLQVGDKVMAYNPKTHQMEAEPVLHVWKHVDSDLIDLTITIETPAHDGKPATKQSEVIHTTSEHPFLTEEQGFVPAGQLKVGMHVRRADGSFGIVSGWKTVTATRTMYNLEVQQNHTFAVGDGEWVVHNRCDRQLLRRNIGLRTGDPYQAQHIIPCELAYGRTRTPNRLLSQALNGGGLNINGRWNGIALPPDANFAAAWGLPYHLGSHGDYTNYVDSLLNQLDELLALRYGGVGNIPDAAAAREVQGLAAYLENAYWELGNPGVNAFFNRAGDCINDVF